MSKTVETLVPGETLLVSAKGVKGGKISLEFAEIIRNPNAQASNPLVAAFNASDSRFSSRARRAWMSGEQSDIERLLGITLGSIGQGDSKELNILSPKVNGVELSVQITETTTPDDYQKDNREDTAKRAGKDGDFIMSDGKHIFSNTTVVGGEANHTFLAPDSSEESAEPVSAQADELAA